MKLQITLTLETEDWENLPIAIGYAFGVMSRTDLPDEELGTRAKKRLLALFEAYKSATVRDIPEGG